MSGDQLKFADDGLPQCVKCLNHPDSFALVNAAASVGIEHGKSTAQMLREYLIGYHRDGHGG